jgi:hypothetical protein
MIGKQEDLRFVSGMGSVVDSAAYRTPPDSYEKFLGMIGKYEQGFA